MSDSSTLFELLSAFQKSRAVVTVGAMGTALVITRKYGKAVAVAHKQDKTGPRWSSRQLLTQGGGQVAGLSGRAINKILSDHGVSDEVGTESGRTSRGTPTLAIAYAELLEQLSAQGLFETMIIERWWVQRFQAYFSSEPFRLSYDESKTLVLALRSVIDQAQARQKRMPGKTYVGAVLQHLVGAKLELALPELGLVHHGASVADTSSSRDGDFLLDAAVIHCTTMPTPELLKKCKANLEAGLRPMILTLGKSMDAAEQAAENIGIEGRVEVLDALQFVAANLYEMSRFKSVARKTAVATLLAKYNQIVGEHEADTSLRIDMG